MVEASPQVLRYLPPQRGFLGLGSETAIAAEDARAVIVPFGLEATVSYGDGTALGPEAIVAASHQVELFDEEFWREVYLDYGVATLDNESPAPGQIEDSLALLGQLIEELLRQGKFPLTLGGEHSITAGIIPAFCVNYPDLAILHFDAHADLRDGYDGEKYSHAAALRRCLDNPVTALVSVGIRNISAEEIPFLEANRERISIHWAKDRAHWNIEEIIAPLRGKPVYLTFDLDGFDSSLMAATGTPEPGGIFWQDAMDIISAASKVSTIVGADVVELAPKQGLHACDFLAAKLCYKILNYSLHKK